LNYAVYSGARFILASTPSGISLSAEGGAHQSIYTPLIGMGQPGLAYYEPAYADEVRILICLIGVACRLHATRSASRSESRRREHLP
jgi:pyruvate dehydrogenase complex dehydrogenase (E1) component